MPATIDAASPPKPRLRGYSHLLAFVSALTLAPIMILIAPAGWTRAIIAIHAIGITAMFGVSALYHRGSWSARALGVIRRLDHSMIFLAIAGTYTPVAVFGLPSRSAWVVLTVVWVGSVIGIVARVAWSHAHPAVVYALKAPNPWPHTFGFHEIFHLFVVAGAAVHYVAVAFVALPKA